MKLQKRISFCNQSQLKLQERHKNKLGNLATKPAVGAALIEETTTTDFKEDEVSVAVFCSTRVIFVFK